jgi:hypothetical protein
MSLSKTEHKSARGAVVSNDANTRLTGPWLFFARVVWLALVVPSLALFVVSLPAYYQLLQRACVPTVCINFSGALTAQGLQVLSPIGFSASGYATLFTIFNALLAAIWCAIGLLLFWRCLPPFVS